MLGSITIQWYRFVAVRSISTFSQEHSLTSYSVAQGSPRGSSFDRNYLRPCPAHPTPQRRESLLGQHYSRLRAQRSWQVVDQLRRQAHEPDHHKPQQRVLGHMWVPLRYLLRVADYRADSDICPSTTWGVCLVLVQYPWLEVCLRAWYGADRVTTLVALSWA